MKLLNFQVDYNIIHVCKIRTKRLMEIFYNCNLKQICFTRTIISREISISSAFRTFYKIGFIYSLRRIKLKTENDSN